MSINELQAACKEYRELKRMVEEIDAELEALADRIKAALGEADTMTAGEYKISYKTVKGSRLDTTALRRELPELAAKYTIQTTARRFLVS